MTREDKRTEQAKNYNSTMIDSVCEYIEQYAPISNERTRK